MHNGSIENKTVETRSANIYTWRGLANFKVSFYYGLHRFCFDNSLFA